MELKNPPLAVRKNRSHDWDLNEDLIVKIKQGKDEDSEAGIKVWEMKDEKKYTLKKSGLQSTTIKRRGSSSATK